jgi:hypothetical protein
MHPSAFCEPWGPSRETQSFRARRSRRRKACAVKRIALGSGGITACSEPLSDHPRRPFYRFHAPSWYGPLRHFPPGPVHPMDMYGRPSSLSVDESRVVRPGIVGDSDFDQAMRYCEHHPLAPMRVLADALEKAPDTQRITEWPDSLLWLEYDQDKTQVRLTQPPSAPADSKCITVLQFFTTENTDCWFGDHFWRNARSVCHEYPGVRFIRILSEKYEDERRSRMAQQATTQLVEGSNRRRPQPDWQLLITALERERLGGTVAVDTERLELFRAVGAIGWPFYVVLAPTGTVLAKWYQGSPCGGPSMDEENGHVLLLDIVLAGAMDYYANQLCCKLSAGQFSLLPDFRKPPSFEVSPEIPQGRTFSAAMNRSQSSPAAPAAGRLRLRYPTKAIVVRRHESKLENRHAAGPSGWSSDNNLDMASLRQCSYLVIADMNNDRIIWCRLNEEGGVPTLDLHHWGNVEGLNRPRGVCYDSVRDLVYIADTGNHRICRFRIPPASKSRESTSFAAEWIAGTGAAKFDLYGTRRAREQSLAFPWDVAIGPVVPQPKRSAPGETQQTESGPNTTCGVSPDALYVTNSGLNQLWRVDFYLSRNEEEEHNPVPRSCRAVCGSGDHRQLDITKADDERWRIEPPRKLCFVPGLAQPAGLVLVSENRSNHATHDGPYLVFVDSESSSVRYYAMGSRSTHTLAGGGSATGDIDDLFEFGHVDHNEGRQARFQHPLGLAFDSSRKKLFIADTYNHCIREIDWNTGTVATVRLVGCADSSRENESKLAQGTAAMPMNPQAFELRSPAGVSVDPDAFQGRGALWVADTNANRILCVEWIEQLKPSGYDTKQRRLDCIQAVEPHETISDKRITDADHPIGLLGRVHVVWDNSVESSAGLASASREP